MSPIFCAVDTKDLSKAKRLVATLGPMGCGFKLGLEFFTSFGPDGVRALELPKEAGLFIDLKLHDIPNTVGGAAASLVSLQADFLTVHASGGPAMLRAAKQAVVDEAGKQNVAPPKILAVTVLTSLDDDDLRAVGQQVPAAEQVKKLAGTALDAGCDGIVCAPTEVAMLRETYGPDFVLMVPGIRPEWAVKGDQKRVMTPRQAIDAGATHLVIGRPITGADQPTDAFSLIMDELRLVA